MTERMSEKLARRGPDHAGTFLDGPLAFGHRRLAIIDLSATADQPMVASTLKLALVFNGKTYNYRELRAELIAAGYAFFSEGDREVILKSHHAQGDQCVKRDPVALHHHFSLHTVVPARRTVLSGARKLPPATTKQAVWHLALLECWLQIHVDGVVDRTSAAGEVHSG